MSDTDDLPDARLHLETVTHRSFVWILLRGELDIATAAELGTVLRAVQLVEHQSVHFHVEEVRFVDVAALQQLVRFARRATGAGHAVMTCRAQPMFRRVVGLLGVQNELGVFLDCPSRPVTPASPLHGYRRGSL